MDENKLMLSQRNDVFKAISAADMPSSDFEWFAADSKGMYSKVPALGHKPSNYYFVFDYQRGNGINTSQGRVGRYSPGEESPTASAFCGSWGVMLRQFGSWLNNLKRETEETDLWSDDVDDEDFKAWKISNDKFTKDELIKIEEGLNRVESILIEHSDKSEKVLKDIGDTVKYLKESAAKAGKRDWLLMFVGTFVTKLTDWALGNIGWQHLFKTLLSGTKLLK